MKTKIFDIIVSVKTGKSVNNATNEILNLLGNTTIINPHFDNNGKIDGGMILINGVITGHIDSCGEQGEPGWDGIKI